MTATNGTIEHFSKSVPMGPRLIGRWLVRAKIGCWYPPEVEITDTLDVDFDVRQFRDDGLYLLEFEPKEDGRWWRGCRRISLTPDGSLVMDESGRGDWKTMDPAVGFEIVGFVHEVYKPSLSKGGAA